MFCDVSLGQRKTKYIRLILFCTLMLFLLFSDNSDFLKKGWAVVFKCTCTKARTKIIIIALSKATLEHRFWYTGNHPDTRTPSIFWNTHWNTMCYFVDFYLFSFFSKVYKNLVLVRYLSCVILFLFQIYFSSWKVKCG